MGYEAAREDVDVAGHSDLWLLGLRDRVVEEFRRSVRYRVGLYVAHVGVHRAECVEGNLPVVYSVVRVVDHGSG